MTIYSYGMHQELLLSLAKKCGNKALITYEIRNRLPDKNGNPYPTWDQCYIICTKTAASQPLAVLSFKPTMDSPWPP